MKQTNGSLSWNAPSESFASMWYSCTKVFRQTQNSYLFRIWSSWVYTVTRAIGHFWVPFNLYFKVSEAFVMNISLHSHWNSNQLPKKNFALSLPLKERIQHRLTILIWIDLIHNSSRKRSKATFSPCNPNNDRHRNMILMRSPHLQLLIKKPTYASVQTEKGKRQTPMETQ